MKRSILISFFLISSFCMMISVQAQENQEAGPYKTAIGVRLGSPLSVSLKHFLAESIAVEGYIGTRGYSFYRWTNISAAVQIHKPLTFEGEIEGLSYYYGVGGSAFFWNYNDGFIATSLGTTTFGVQGYLGLDYGFENLPINLSLDWIPTFFVGDVALGSSFGAGYGTLGVRYSFGNR